MQKRMQVRMGRTCIYICIWTTVMVVMTTITRTTVTRSITMVATKVMLITTATKVMIIMIATKIMVATKVMVIVTITGDVGEENEMVSFYHFEWFIYSHTIIRHQVSTMINVRVYLLTS